MRTKKHCEKMLSENPNTTIGFTIAADMVFAAVNGQCDVSDHIEQSWRDIARRLKNKYGENLSVDEVRAEMIKRPAAAALGSIKSPKKAASSRENGKKGGRPTEKKTYWILSGEGENGTWEKHIATLTGIKRIATKERCGGDRWAQIWEEIPETDTTEAHICNIDDGDMRDVPDED